MCCILFDRFVNWLFGICLEKNTENLEEKGKENYMRFSFYEMKKKDLIDNKDLNDKDDIIVSNTNNQNVNNDTTIINIIEDNNKENDNKNNEWDIMESQENI